MEVEALGGISGDVLDIGCRLADNSIYLASRGHSVTGLDGSTFATLTANGWRIDFLGPTTYLGNALAFGGNEFPDAIAEQVPPEAVEQMRGRRPVREDSRPDRRRPDLSAVHRRARAPRRLDLTRATPHR